MKSEKENVVISDKRIVAFYLNHGVKPIDMFLHEKTNAIMFVYNRKNTSQLYTDYLKSKESEV